jgi:NADH:ubiquinone oxidoreductase subunit F (NADH-binding)/NADH:ubiquinone oxidoreductase subunit E
MTGPRSSTASLVSRFPRERTWLLPALDLAQRAEGWVSPETLAAIAAHLRVPASEVWGVASHYPEVRLRRPGRRLVRVCAGVACRVVGGGDLLEALERRLGVRAGETAADGSLTLEAMDCAFACGVAPVVEADHRRWGRVGLAELDRVLAEGARPSTATPPTAASIAAAARAGGPEERHRALVAAAGSGTASVLAVGTGSCGLAVGAGETLAELRAEIARRRLAVGAAAAGCGGACWAAPTVTVRRAGAAPVVIGPVPAARVATLLDAVAAGREGELAVGHAYSGERRVLLARAGILDAGDLADAIRLGAYATLASVLAEGRPERVLEDVRAAGLEGRGGAYFSTATKWAACRQAPGAPKWIVVNGEEGEPGICKDRHLMEADPHLLLEGVLLAAYAVGATRGILYVHGEADLSAARLEAALGQARAAGLVGERILGADFSLEIELRRGLGGFVLGEETALLESIEGRRAMPRPRPPFPVEAGLWGRPTVINNVETLCAVPAIVARGGAWWAGLGRGHGTKLFGLSGDLGRPGVVEVEAGATLRTLLEAHGGGPADGRPLRAAVVGGPSGSVVPPRLFDEPLMPRGPVNPGTGGVVALGRGASVREAVRTLLAFNARESCGKCTPCREGTARLLAMLDGPLDAARVRALAEVVQVASLCGLGQAAPYAVLSGLAEFPDEFPAVS